MTKFTGFNEMHVGEKVTDINLGQGTIVEFAKNNNYPVSVEFNNDNMETYSVSGYSWLEGKEDGCQRDLYFGHNIKVEVTGEELPKLKLICPICGIEHEIGNRELRLGHFFYFKDTGAQCPFEFSIFEYKGHAIDAMKDLIKAINQKQ